MNGETSTPIRKQVRPDISLFDSAIKEGSNFTIESSQTPITPNKSARTKHLLNIETPKCSLTPTRPYKINDDSSTKVSDRYFRILPSPLFKDIASLPSSSEDSRKWLDMNFKLADFLGSGGFSSVFAVEDTKTGIKYALKKVSLKNASSFSVHNFRREIINLWCVKGCKNCVQIYLGWEDESSLNILTDIFKMRYIYSNIILLVCMTCLSRKHRKFQMKLC